MTIIWNQSVVHCTFIHKDVLDVPYIYAWFESKPNCSCAFAPCILPQCSSPQENLRWMAWTRSSTNGWLAAVHGYCWAGDDIYIILNLASFTSSALKSTTRPISSLKIGTTELLNIWHVDICRTGFSDIFRTRAIPIPFYCPAISPNFSCRLIHFIKHK